MAHNSPVPGTNMFETPNKKIYLRQLQRTPMEMNLSVQKPSKKRLVMPSYFIVYSWYQSTQIHTINKKNQFFNNAFCTDRKNRLDSENYLDISIDFPHIKRAILLFLPPPKKGENSNYVSYVKKSKDNKMEDILEECAEKCAAYDKKLFVKGCQNSHHDAVACLANLVVFLDFILDDEGTSEVPAIIFMFRSIGRILVSPPFQNYAKKNEEAIPWLTHTLVCQF